MMGAPAPASDEVAALRQEVAVLRTQFTDLVAQLNALRAEVAQMKGQPAPAPLRMPAVDVGRPGERAQAAPGRESPASAPVRDPGLESLFRRLIGRDLPKERADRLAQEITEYVGDNRALQKQAADMMVVALTRNYGTPYAQQLMRGLQGKWR
jgi:hypothetical protein